MNRRQTIQRRATQMDVRMLEDRSTPAAIAYSDATQTLNIFAAENDQVQIGTVMNVPGGDINIKVNAVEVFVSAPMSRPVKNITVRFNGIDHGELYINPQVVLAGNLTVRGARVTQFMSNRADVLGRLTYWATGEANDDVRFDDTVHVGGNADIRLGAGANKLYLFGGSFAGNLSIKSGMGDDTVGLLMDDNLTITKSLTINLGGGNNRVEGMANHVLEVGGHFLYRGGSMQDTFALAAHHADLIVVGHATFQLGNAPEAVSNYLHLGKAQVGGNLGVYGGARGDVVRTFDRLLVDGSLRVQLGGGTNSLTVDDTASSLSQIGGQFQYLGGASHDEVIVDGLFVDKNMTLALGGSQDDSQFARIGTVDGVLTHGRLRILGGSRREGINIANVIAFKGLAVQVGAGNDLVYIDNVSISETTVIDLGGGVDDLHIETIPAFAGSATFVGRFTVFTGAGADWVNLSDDGNATTLINFGGNLSLFSGAGVDLLDNFGNNFSVNGNFENFEFGDSLP